MITRILNSRLPLMIYTPVKVFDSSYFHAIYRSGALPVFDTEFLTRDDILEKAQLLAQESLSFGLRLAAHDHDTIADLKLKNIANLDLLIVPLSKQDEAADLSHFGDTKIVTEIKDIHLIEKIKAKEIEVDFVEVMSCIGGCVAGAGQPFSKDSKVIEKRINGLRNIDKSSQINNSKDNFFVKQHYDSFLEGCPGSDSAHKKLHVKHNDLSEVLNRKLSIHNGTSDKLLEINISVSGKKHDTAGKTVLKSVMELVKKMNIEDFVSINALLSFNDSCFTVSVGTYSELFKFTDNKIIPSVIDKVEQKIRQHIG